MWPILLFADWLSRDYRVVICYYVELASARLCDGYGLIGRPGRPNHDGDMAGMTRSHIVEVLFPQIA